MKEHPISFNDEMVRALISGWKTQTRRIVKPQPSCEIPGAYFDAYDRGPQWNWWTKDNRICNAHDIVKCPYGVPGDQLWVRERQRVIETNQTPKGVGNSLCVRVRYEANDEESGWIQYPEGLKGIPIPNKCLAYGGYRESSRLILKVKAVRVERVQEITEADARAEGITDGGCLNCGESEPCRCSNPMPCARDSFVRLWNSINAKRGFSWSENPRVWVVGFSNISVHLQDSEEK